MQILKNTENEKINNILKEANIFANDVVIKKIVGENSNSVFRVYCNGESYALKIFSGKDGKDQLQANIFFNEFARKNNIKTPRIVYSSPGKKSSDDCWILWEWFHGKSFFETDSVSDKNEIALEAGIQLRKIHEVKISEIENKFIENKNIKKSLEFFKNRINVFVEKGCSAFSQEELNDIFRFTIESKELSSFADLRLLHGDFTGGNVLASQKEISIIDPGEIVIGDPMSDLGYSQNTSLSDIFRAGVLDGYAKNNALMDVDHDRFLRWRLLRQCIVAYRAVLNKNKNAEKLVYDTRKFLEELRKRSMKRILILGSSGSGKSTFAKKLHDILDLPLIYLDQHYWKPGWQKTDNKEWQKIVEKLSQGDQWIIEGNYSKELDTRAKRADAIIFFERSRFLCLYRYFKRILFKRECGSIDGCEEKPTWKMINWILWEFPQNRKKELVEKINLFKRTKPVYILKNENDIENFLLDIAKIKII